MTDLPAPPERIPILGTEIATSVLEPETGNPAGDVVLCHGTPWSAETWLPVARALARSFRVFLWDMPGYGRSIRGSDPPVDLVHQRHRLTALIDHWDLDRPHVVAHDIGGAVALGSHLLDGAAFASLYLLDVVALDPWGSPFFRLASEHHEVLAALPENLHAALVREYISGAGGDTLTPARVEELARPWCSPRGQVAFYRQIAALTPDHTAPIVARLAETRCPVHIGWGADDSWIPVAQAAELAGRFPGQPGVTTFQGTGHLVQLEAPTELALDLRRWLGTLSS